jgi:arylsulfatase A
MARTQLWSSWFATPARALRRVGLSALLGNIVAPAVAAAPNIVLILADDQGYADVSFTMDPKHPAPAHAVYFETPNLERLAREGMRFTQGYAPAPICTPTRRSIQFGKTPARLRGTAFPAEGFDATPHDSLAQMLKKVDPAYRAAHFGKWGEIIQGSFDNPWTELPAHPQVQGYDRSDGITGNYTGWNYHPKHDPENRSRDFKVEAWDDPKLTFSVTEKAIDFAERSVEAGRPFYLQVSYYAPHRAAQALPSTIAKFAAKRPAPPRVDDYVAMMVHDMDQGVGMLLDTLDALGIADNTYVIFTSDNGGYGSDGWDWSDLETTKRNHPLRGIKGTLLEGGIRVPFIVRGPGVKAGSVSDVPVSGVDFWPTFREMAGGGRTPEDLDGGSFLGILRNAGQGEIVRPRPFLVFHSVKNRQSALRMGEYKLFVQRAFNKYRAPETRVELYNVIEDPGELNNLAEEMPEKTAEMSQALIGYLRQVNAEEPIAFTQGAP